MVADQGFRGIDIVFAHGADTGASFRGTKDTVVIGRPKAGLPVDLDLTPDARVSRPHARIVVDDTGTWIEDLDSKFGTLVNNRNIKGHGRWRVCADDVIVIGDTKLRVVSAKPAEPAAAAAAAAAPDDEELSWSDSTFDPAAESKTSAAFLAAGGESLRPGDIVDSFEIQELLGQGGMGSVYLAMQASPISRQVALKVISLAEHSGEIVARFKLEQQALALMNHQNIATVFDAGTTPRGAPYFVMEYVEGMPITGYCDSHRLPVPARVRILRDVCQAVEHAHSRGVIHRDLKPTNILVTHKEDRPVPKIIDFGLARSLGPIFGRQVHTEAGQILGTPEYMAPEQAAHGVRVVDARADVYGLGVILYELLTGTLPFPSRELRRGGLEEMLNMIAEVSPPKPSQQLTPARDIVGIAQKRRTTIRRLRTELTRDLDWVANRAMQKDPLDRYSSASAMADDLSRYLGSEPVRARPRTAGYVLERFVSRWRRRLSRDETGDPA